MKKGETRGHALNVVEIIHSDMSLVPLPLGEDGGWEDIIKHLFKCDVSKEIVAPNFLWAWWNRWQRFTLVSYSVGLGFMSQQGLREHHRSVQHTLQLIFH
jgi:hypothetical protein